MKDRQGVRGSGENKDGKRMNYNFRARRTLGVVGSAREREQVCS